MTMFSFSGTVLITGASAGIGEACARAFAAAGARLILAARRTDRLSELAEELRAGHGTETCLLALDVRDVGVVTRVLEDLPSEWAGIDVLVNNAGLGRGLEPVHEADSREWDEMIDTNVKGLLYVTRAVVPGMLARGRGHVIHLGSIAATEIYPGGTVYCATKAAVDVINRGMRMDLHGTPIRVTSVNPGAVETEFSLVRFRGDQQRAERVYQGFQPLTPADVADAVLYAATRPPHVDVEQIVLKPVAQAAATMIHRQG
jgi:3-hydroxy acid dehydrogenase / malonic semialdehyde reductase